MSHSIVLFFYLLLSLLNLFIVLSWGSFLRDSILTYKSLNLVYVRSAHFLSNTKFFCGYYHVIPIVERQFTHHSISQINIEYMIIFSRREKFIAIIIFLLWKSLSSRCPLCTWINYFSNVFPFLFHDFPHISRWYSIFFEHLNISFSFSFNFRLLAYIWSFCKLFHICRCGFWLYLLLKLLQCISKISSWKISSKCPYFVIFSSNY